MPLLWPSTRSARSAVAVVKSTVWPELEVEVLQGFHRREVRDLDPHLDPAALLGGHLIAQQLVEEVDVRRLHPRRFAQRRIEAIGERAEAQPLEMIDDTGVDELGTHPPTSATATA